MVCSTNGYHDERDCADVTTQFLWWEVQPNNHVLEKGFADPSSFVFECEGIDGFFEPFPTTPSDRVCQ